VRAVDNGPPTKGLIHTVVWCQEEAGATSEVSDESRMTDLSGTQFVPGCALSSGSPTDRTEPLRGPSFGV
jgi:hypothetical protein